MRILVILIFSLSAIANDCHYSFSKYGSGDVHNQISDSCIQNIISNASDAKKVQSDGKNFVAGSNALLILDDNMQVLKMIAGEYSSLENIIAIAVSLDHNEIALLEDISFEVKVFSTQYAGNMAPLRVIRTNELIGSSSIAYVGDKICAYNPIQKTTYQYSKDANANRREQFRNLNLVGKIDGTDSISCIP